MKPAPDESDSDDEPLFGVDIPLSGEEGEMSESEDKREISEDMNHRETVKSRLAFMGGILFQILNLTLGYSSNNLWKGKIPRKPVKCQWKCQLMTGCVKRWNG